MKNTKVAQISEALSSRYGLPSLDYDNWGGLVLFGGIGMDFPTFNALATVAVSQGDKEATVYEMESCGAEFPPITIHLNFESFNRLKADTACLFDIAVLPSSRRWVALLTSDLKTSIYGLAEFLADVSQGVPNGMQIDGDEHD